MGDRTIVQLGRHGDLLNAIPIAYRFHKQGYKVNWLVLSEHLATLTGCSYINPVPWGGRTHDTLPAAVEFARQHFSNVVVTQAWMNPDPRQLTDSFALEQWRLAGCLEDYGKYPLLFDNRNPQREADLIQKHIPDTTRPIVLVSTTSISTPYPLADKLIALIRGLDATVIDMDNVRADCVYDLLGLYEKAVCLVTVDTMHLHLAKASYCPVIALINNGWRGAVPPPQTIVSWRYAEVGNDLSPVIEATRKQLARKADSIAVVINTFNPTTERHKRAFATHPKDAIYVKVDHRPRMKELLSKGLERNPDIIVYTNDDVSFMPDTLKRIREHALKWNFGCSRRPRDPVHIGREILWFRTDWLKANWDKVPDPYWTVQKPDLIMARWMRERLGIPSTLENLHDDFPPVELPAGLVQHEDHESHWNKPEILNSVEGQYNEKIWATA